MRTTSFAVLCVACVIIMLIAGLWPFRAPANNVTWLQAKGIQFGHHGSIVSVGAFPSAGDRGTLELWLVAAPAEQRHTILAFEGTGKGDSPFRLQQLGDSLIVQRHNVDDHGTNRTAEFHVDHALPEGKRVFVTVTLAPHETSVYLNGVFARTVPISGDSKNNFSGRVVLGNSPAASDSWPGQVLGIAVYPEELSASSVAKNYDRWTRNQADALMAVAPTALYLFDEHEGRSVRNYVNHATDITIPPQYFVLHPEFLSLPWSHFHNTWSYWGDVVVNVVGFAPFGFSMAGYLSSARPGKAFAVITIALGLLLSLTIEVLQAFLPTRDSGVNDLITNPLGTAMGVMIYTTHWLEPFVQSVISRVAPVTSEKIQERLSA